MDVDDVVEEPINVQVDGRWVKLVPAAPLRKAAVETLRLCAGTPEDGAARGALSIVVVDDDAIQQLNHDYRGVDATTDVLAFGQEIDAFVSACDESGDYLGDVVISFPRARQQAEEAGHNVVVELSLLVVHGVLHLLGLDHADAAERAAMWDLQDRVLRSLGFHGVRPNEGE